MFGESVVSKYQRWVLHPFLFTLFPIFSLYVNNLGQVPFIEAARPLLVGLVVAGMVLVILRQVLSGWHRAGLVTTFAALQFFTFGQVLRLIGSVLGKNHLLSQPGWLFALWGALFLLWARFCARLKYEEEKITIILNLAGAAALVTCLYGLGVYRIRSVQASAVVEDLPPVIDTKQPQVVTTFAPPTPPDIYWIILDGYGREDILWDLYQVNNAPFLSFLRERGFYIASDAHSNYGQTALSLASTLNVNYIDQLIDLNPNWNDRAPLTALINNSVVQDVLVQRGYHTIAFSNGYPVTQMVEADRFIQREGEINSFEVTLLSGSLGDGGTINEALIDNYRKRILWQADEVKQLAKEDGPKFVFAHFILPHPPFVFHTDGSLSASLAGADGSNFNGTREEYLAGYGEQVLFTNHLVQEIVSSILENSKRPPFIILQGDHGPGSRLDWSYVENTCISERFSILNAYYFPDGDYADLSPDITPVNSFRVILNHVLGTNLAQLHNRSYYSTWEKPFDFQEVTGQVDTACR
jgi:hypothetical protein